MPVLDFALPVTPLLDLMKQAVIVTDARGLIVSWNSFAEDLYGWRADEVIRRPIASVLPAPSDASRTEIIFSILRRGESWGGQFTARTRDGQELEVFAIVAPVMDGSKLQGAVGISTPIPSIAPWPHGVDNRDTLTRREIEIATLTASGETSAEIAELLRVSVRTVESHRFNIYRKLGIRNRAELVMLAFRHGVSVHNQFNRRAVSGLPPNK
ncbi:MAG TPA: LuxR C-terminal-related transcriptional regulator [Thermoanaerobaculia bacterium]|nr:LuxR C-terminal-related transcriptional regulator [Thermoanaerobaculia bacterium]